MDFTGFDFEVYKDLLVGIFGDFGLSKIEFWMDF